MSNITILPETTKNPISLIGSRAGVCWNGDITDSDKNFKRGLECINSNHGRTLEYINIETIIDGYSARVIREFYTHIAGDPTRLQASTRYINYKNFEFITPRRIKLDDGAKSLYENTMQAIAEACERLEKDFNIPREDAAMLLPLGMTTKIVDKRNLRNVIDMSRQRLCSRAYWEYRQLMNDYINALRDYSEEWKYLIDELNIFHPKCDEFGYCPENKGCGKYPSKDELLKSETYDELIEDDLK